MLTTLRSYLLFVGALVASCTVPDPSFQGSAATTGAETTDASTGGTTSLDPSTGGASATSSSTTQGGDGTTTTSGSGVRVVDGLVALYTFDNQDSDVVRDEAGVVPAIDLVITEPSNVEWTTDGLTLQQSTMVVENGESVRVADACRASESVTVEAWIQPRQTEGVVEARIVTMSRGTSLRNFSLGQTGTDYWFRIRTTETTVNGGEYLLFPGAAPRLQHVVVARDPDGVVRMYVDAEKVAQAFRVGSLEDWRSDFIFGLGNEMGLADGEDRAWLGGLGLVAVYSRGLSDDEVLVNFNAGP